MRSRAFQKMLAAVCVAVVLGAMTPPEAPVADAAMRGDVETVRALLRNGADVNEAQGDGMTALHWAARNDNVELAGVLIYAGANLDAGTRIGRYTPLHVAAREGNSRIVDVLLGAGSSPEAVTTNSGATPLHLAASSGDSSDRVSAHRARSGCRGQRYEVGPDPAHLRRGDEPSRGDRATSRCRGRPQHRGQGGGCRRDVGGRRRGGRPDERSSSPTSRKA